MSSELPVKFQDLSPEYAEIMVLANVLMKSGYFKDLRDQAQAVTKILFGRDLNFSPTVSLQSINIIDGKPSLSATLLGALIKRSGKYNFKVREFTNVKCVIEFFERDNGAWDSLGTSEFTIDDAKTAGLLGKTSWKNYPKAMLYARALSQGQRAHCPDVSVGPLYVPEELGADVNEEGEVTQLPRSARPVAVTTEDIVIGGAGDGAKQTQEGDAPAPNKDEVLKELIEKSQVNVSADVKRIVDKEIERRAHELEPILTAARVSQPVPVSQIDAEKLLKDALIEAKAVMSAKPAALPADCIELGQAVNFERTFRDALKPALRKQAEEISHDWLKRQGIVDGDGTPTAKAILKQNYYDVREEAVAYAASLEVWK